MLTLLANKIWRLLYKLEKTENHKKVAHASGNFKSKLQ